MLNFEWNDFYQLTEVRLDEQYIIVMNDHGMQRKMNRKTYYLSAEDVYNKARTLIGKQVQLRISKDIRNSTTGEWFTEISDYH
ncbi:MAG: hypothetical protein JKY55_03650 [Aliivibrio sp.]|uniref:hypothetical protein n=1 Tax=Aliivibrio sp. TaxID=1872443 RepID=UPI001A3D3E41|nr:hypothetical protein [Aliivibrio sp.]